MRLINARDLPDQKGYMCCFLLVFLTSNVFIKRRLLGECGGLQSKRSLLLHNMCASVVVKGSDLLSRHNLLWTFSSGNFAGSTCVVISNSFLWILFFSWCCCRCCARANSHAPCRRGLVVRVCFFLFIFFELLSQVSRSYILWNTWSVRLLLESGLAAK